MSKKKIASGATGGSSAPQQSTGGSGAFVQEFQDLVSQFLTPFEANTKTIGDATLTEQVDLFMQAVAKQKEFLQIAANSKKPSDSLLQDLIKPTSTLMSQITAIKDNPKNRSNKFFNNISAVAEGVNALGWVVVSPTPGPHINEMRGSAEFWTNKILKDFKGKDENQVSWASNFIGFFKELFNYVKKNHTTGVTWNPKGGEATSAPSSSPAPTTTSSSTPAPSTSSGPSSTPKPAVNLLNAISLGEGVTSGLKKVTADMKTKNRSEEEKVSVVSASAVSKAKVEPKLAKPPKFELQGNKWVVEYQDGANIEIEPKESRNTVYIFKCRNTTVQVKGKVNAINLDSCERTGIVFQDVIAGVEVVNCKSAQIQSLNKIPTITIDKTAGAQVFLSKESIQCQIITGTSSECNVSFPVEGKEDFVESPICEQFFSQIKEGKLVTIPYADHV